MDPREAEAVSIDCETFSVLDLKKVGAHRYAEHPSTEVLVLCYRFPDGERGKWLPGERCPSRVRRHIESGGLIRAWNAQFERLILQFVMGPKYGWPVPALRQYRCTMVRSYTMGLPGKLDTASHAVGLPEGKDKIGSKIMLELCKPRKSGRRWTRENAPYKFQRLDSYCAQDVDREFEINDRVLHLRPDDLELYFLDQEINDRGVFIDMPLVKACQGIVTAEMTRLDREMREVTGYRVDRVTKASEGVESCSAVAQIKRFLVETGLRDFEVDDSLDKEGVENLLVRDDLTNTQRTVVELRKEAGKASTAKLKQYDARRTAYDGRAKGTLQFRGAASTGRWAARGIQLQNLPRPDPILKTDIPLAIQEILKGDIEAIRIMHGPPMTVVADCLRAMIAAPRGKLLRSQDLKQIEARTLPWLAGAEGVLDAFRKFDKGNGPDIYKVTAARDVYGKSFEDITDFERQVGKVANLALGFGGGAMAFASMAKIYRVDMSLIYEQLCDLATDENYDKAHDAYKQRGKDSGVMKEKWVASELVKLAWRDSNFEIVDFWHDLENAAIEAIDNPGREIKIGFITYVMSGSFLRCRLPSSRSIYYPDAHIVDAKTPWGKVRPEMRYSGMGKNNKWQTQKAYGGLLAENPTQAVACDVMSHGLVLAADHGYLPILSVHDEVVAENDDGFGSDEEFQSFMTKRPFWAPGLPIAADGWHGMCYRKG